MNVQGEKFILRRVRKNDFESWAANIIDKEIYKNFVTNPRNLREARKEFREKILAGKKKGKDSDDFIIDMDGKAVGEIGLHLIISRLSAKVDYWIGKEHRGKGIITEALKILVYYGFKKYGLRRIYAQARTFNKSSARVLEKAGFQLEGIKRKDVLKDGKYYDSFLYARIR